MIVPNAALPKLVFGAASGGVLVTLNASARNSARSCSVIGNVLPTITSRVAITGTDNRIARSITDRELRRLCEGGRVEPAAVRALVGR